MFKNFNPSALGVSGHQSEIIELALSFGFTGIDVSITEFASRARLKGMDFAARLIHSAKIRVGTFALPIDWEADDDTFKKDVKRLSEYADCAKALGCSRCTSIVAPAGDSRPYHENFEFHRHRLGEVCAALQPAGVSLAMGFRSGDQHRKNRAFQFIHDFDALTLLVNMAAAPNLGLLLDVWEVIAGGGSLENVAKLPREQIVSVELAEMPAGVAPADLDDKSRLLPGAENGRIDLVAVLTMLREKGYDGPVTIRPSRNAFPSRRRDVIVKQTAEALDKVWRAAGLSPIARPVLAAAHSG
jgi:sugar phosphate isomerase/epimerase